MAGHRRQDEGPPKPLKRQSKYERRRNRMLVALGAAPTPRARVAAAAQYLAAAIAACHLSPERGEAIVKRLIADADALFRQEGATK